MARKYIQGTFKPRNPAKYKGDVMNIFYRSSWELRCMSEFDNNPNVIQWSNEETIVRYVSPIDGKWHRYFPDFVIKTKSTDNKLSIQMIEIKPFAQTVEPKKQKKITKRYITEVQTWGINQAKWQAAVEYCVERGWIFKVVTEKDLGI